MAGGASRWSAIREKVVKRVVLLANLARAVPWLAIRRTTDPGASLVVWVHHRAPTSLLRYLLREDTVVKDAGLVAALCERSIPFRLVFGERISEIRECDVVYTIHPYNLDRVLDYSVGLMRGLRRVEANGNRLVPSSSEAEWWENKVFMHRRFDELGVHCPPTTIVDLTAPVDAATFEYPVLAKEPHSSGSRGLHSLASADELQRLATDLAAAGETALLVQRRIDMRRDFRATFVGDRIVHSYFRINTSDAWKPTSTSRGSVVDFDSFPERWRSYLVETFSKLGLHSGAFDVCWEGDDLDTEPYILEVSPSYTPNPPPPPGWDQPYYAYKSKLFGPDSYSKASIATVFEIAGMLVEEYGLADRSPR